MKEDVDIFPEITEHDVSWIGGLGPLGALFGALSTTFLLKRFGPRRTVSYFGAPAIIASWVTIALSQSLLPVLCGRILGGIGTGVIISCSPLYVIDISSVTRRGRLGIVPQFLMILGILLGYVLGSFLSWRYLAVACSIITAPCIILLLIAPDTPSWLISRNRIDDAHKVLERLHGTTTAVSALQALQAKIGNDKIRSEKFSGVRGPRISPAIIKSSCVVLGLMSFQQLVGINGVTFYCVHIFKQTAGVSVWGAHVPSIILASVQLLASFISILIVEAAGRKSLLIVSSTLISVAAGIMGTYFYIGAEYSNLFWVPLAALILFGFAFAIGFGPVTWILCAELLADEVRHIMNPLAIAYNWFCVFLVTKSFPLLLLEINIYGVFWLYSVMGALAFIFVCIFVPETKGKSLAEIREFFGPKNIDNEIEDTPESSKCLDDSIPV